MKILIIFLGINTITTGESYQLGLVATTASGVRLYFTTADNNTSNLRPHNLTLQHVRLPPGFAASSPAGRPSKVHMSYYQNGKFLFFERMVKSFFSHLKQYLGIIFKSLQRINSIIWISKFVGWRDVLCKEGQISA